MILIGNSHLDLRSAERSGESLQARTTALAKRKGKENTAGTGNVVYKSEVAEHTLNPIWLPLDTRLKKDSQLRISSFVLRVVKTQQGEENPDQTTLEFDVDMKRLFPLSTDLNSVDALPANTILFELVDGLYVIESVYVQLRQVVELCCHAAVTTG